jgi:heme A synthase
MAANKQQGQSFGLFLAGLTVFCAGLLGGGFGKVAMVIGIVLLALSFFMMFKIKPLEGKPASGAQSGSMKLLGCVVVLLGWAVVLFGLHLTAGVSGRMVTTIVGIAISLFGLLAILPAACNKNAIWKA